MKTTEAKRRVERVQKHADEGKIQVARDEARDLLVDFVRAAAKGEFGHNARTVAREILPAVEGVEEVKHP